MEARICTEYVENEAKKERQELKLDRKIGAWSRKWSLKCCKRESGIIRCVFQFGVKDG